MQNQTDGSASFSLFEVQVVCFFFCLSRSKRLNDSDVPLKLARGAGVMQMMKYLPSGLSKNEPSDYAGMWAARPQQ